MPSKFQNTREFAELTIASGQPLSTAYELGGTHLVGVLIPASFTGTKLFLQGSIDGINFFEAYGSESGAKSEIKVTEAKFIIVENSFDNPFNYIRLESNQNETAERLLKIVLNP